MRSWSLLVAVLLTVALVSSVAHGQDDAARRPAGEGLVAVTGGRVLTGDGAEFIRGVVLIEGGKIRAVGESVEVPEGSRLIDATGRWVLPGFVAPEGSGFGVSRGRPRRGETYEAVLDPDSRLTELALAAGITTFHHEGPRRGIAGETNAVLKPAYGAPELMLLKQPAAVTLAWSTASAVDRDGFERQLTAVKGWIDGGRKGKRPGSHAVELAVERKIPVRIQARTRADIRQALALAKRHDLRLVLLEAHEAWTAPDELAAADVTVVVHPRARDWPDAGRERSSGSSIEAAAILERNGVPFCVMPPGGFGANPAGISLGGVVGRDLLTYPLDAGFAIRGGASPEAALRAITLTAAEALGVDDRVGSLAPGKDADVLVYQGDPFDHRNLVEIAIVGGRVLYERSKSSFFGHLPDPRDASTDSD